ncbi:MAG: choice-of-anchor X domain-containing protein [Candidatus Fermentibacteria bacterium]
MKKHLEITIERRSIMNKLLGTAASVLVLVLACGCVAEPSAEPTDAENIQNLLSNNSYVRMTPLEGQGESDDGGKDNALPEHWWRELSSEGSFEVILENDPEIGICTVTVIRNLSADFNIDITHDGVVNPSIKPISDIRTRRLIVERTGVSTDPHGGWILTHITPAEYSLNSGIPQEVFIQSMQIYQGEELTWECDSPDAFYKIDEELPVLEPGTLVRLEVEVLHTNPQYEPEYYVFAHGPCPVWSRHWMNDDGLWGDRIAGDGIYSYEWYIEGSSEHWFMAADIIDADTMLDEEEDDYDSGAWGILALKS